MVNVHLEMIDTKIVVFPCHDLVLSPHLSMQIRTEKVNIRGSSFMFVKSRCISTNIDCTVPYVNIF